MGRHARLPVECLEIAGNGANHVGRAVPQVNDAISIKVHCILGHAGGHELWHAHGACIAASDLKWVCATAVLKR